MRIARERELVGLGGVRVGRDERRPVAVASDQPRREFLRVLRRGRGAGGSRDEIVEFLHVLFEMAKDQVGAVAAKLTKVRSGAGVCRGQQGVAVEPRVNRNAGVDRPVAGHVAKEELTRLDEVL